MMAKRNVNIYTSRDMPKRSLRYFEELRNKKELCDFTIHIGNESISAHRIVVTAAIPYFRDVLSSKSEKPDEESIVLPDIEPSALKCLIEFAYSCKVSIDEENVRSLLRASYHLHVKEVRDTCLDFLWNKVDSENALSVREFVSELNCSDLSTKIDCYVRKNFDRVSQTKDFLKCSFSYLKELIEKDDLNVSEEENVFRSVMNWTKASPDDRKMHLPDLLSNVRMVLLKPHYLINIVKNEELIRTSYACRDLIDDARNYISFPETIKDISSFKTQPRGSLAVNNNQENRNMHIWKLRKKVLYTVQYFDVLNGKWVSREIKEFLANEGCTVAMNDKMYYFCWGKTLLYNQENNQYEYLADAPTPRILASASCLKDKIYVCGGKIDGEASNAIECFNPRLNKWSKKRCMPKSVWGASVVTFEDHIFVLGGRNDSCIYTSVERYDPAIDKWEYMPSMNVRRNFAGAAVQNGKIYVCGGNTAAGDSIATTATAEVYDPITRSWKTITNMNTPRCWFTLLPFSEKLYAIGGEHDGKRLHHFEIYDTRSNKWTTGPSTDASTLTSGAVVMPLVCT